MIRRIQILAAVLLLQVGLAASLTFYARDSGAAFQSDEKLIDLELASLDEILIQEKDDPALVLRREDEGGTWILPDHFAFPVSSSRLDRLTQKLFGLTKSWPVGTTEVAAKRFKVTDEDFERKITFRKGKEDVATLLIGTSPGFKKIHARLAGEEAIYAIEFSAYQASVKAENWEDKNLLNVERDEIVRAELPGVRLIREGEALLVSDLVESEETDSSGVSKLLSKLSKPTFLEVLGTEENSEYGQDTPVLAYSLELKSGEVIDYAYSQPKEGDGLVLKLSSRPEYFKISKYSVEQLQEDLTRERLVREKKPVEIAEGQGANGNDEVESEASAVEHEVEGPEPTSTIPASRSSDP